MKTLLASIVALIVLLKQLKEPRRVRQRLCISSLRGNNYTQELLDGPSQRLYELLRLKKSAFITLCRKFRSKGLRGDSKHVSVEEKMAMFLRVIGHNLRNRTIQDRFQHSGQTISKYFHEVLDAMMQWSGEMLVPPANLFDRSPIIRTHRRLREGYFKGAIGALDGTLISAHVPVDKQTPYRGRGRGQCYQNILAICDFDMRFIYVVVGWEGTAHDSRVLNEAVRDPSFNFPLPPQDMYYLCDAAYSHTRGFMCPFRGIRYWLQDFRRGDRARGKEEIFNQAHARLRNVIERSFGVLKARFPILTKMPPYSLETQRDIVIVCMSIHNFLRQESLNDPLFRSFEDDEMEISNVRNGANEEENQANLPHLFGREEQAYMIELREQIANQLFLRHQAQNQPLPHV